MLHSFLQTLSPNGHRPYSTFCCSFQTAQMSNLRPSIFFASPALSLQPNILHLGALPLFYSSNLLQCALQLQCVSTPSCGAARDRKAQETKHYFSLCTLFYDYMQYNLLDIADSHQHKLDCSRPSTSNSQSQFHFQIFFDIAELPLACPA